MNRAEILAEKLPDERTAALITSPLSLRYLCGALVENGIALVAKEQSFLYVRERDVLSVSSKAQGFKVGALNNGRQLLDTLIKYGIKRVLVETDKMTVSEWKIFREQLHYAELSDSEELSEWLVQMRSVKSSEEIAAIENAQAICDKAYERLLGSIRKGMSERQIASLLEFYLTEFGSEGLPFPTVALSGENTAKPYLKPSDRQTREGDFLILEFGAMTDGYCAKMSRTVAAGNVDSRMEDTYNAVSCAISDGITALRGGIGGKVAYSVAASTLNAWKVDQYGSLSFAHGIGLEAYEAPYLGQKSSTILRAGAALAVFCDVRARDKFGVKIGDLAVLTDEGCRVFTKATRKLVHI